MDLEALTLVIKKVQDGLQQQAFQAINQSLTIRNWFIGLYIVEYEQKGSDRAKYGEILLPTLSNRLKEKKIKGMSTTNLKVYRQFFSTYPQIGQSLPDQFPKQLFHLLHEELELDPSSFLSKVEKNLTTHKYSPPPKILLMNFTFTHFVELVKITDPLKRAFYEIEGVKGNWSIRQLKRQIESLLFERTGLSKDKAGLLKNVHEQEQILNVKETIRDPYILEFTGLQEKSQFNENDLETALLNHIQDFLLELGNGFCFEARQKRITIDNEHDRVDLVFYHRILRCHVLIDLKNRKFSYSDAGQMNFYLNYFKENIKTTQDNDPIGIIFCTDKSESRVKYATAGMDKNLFVSKYLVSLPTEEELEEFIEREQEFFKDAIR